ncbi:MAG TPA: HAD family hydrolase [Gaiellaceae bacterium]|nr:HAD family hydrolase [Gaiellaceae bacterium]
MGGPQELRVTAVVFDLWETLIDWDRDANAELNQQLAAIAGETFRERWGDSKAKYNGPIRAALAEAGLAEEHMDDVCALRQNHLRRALTPRPGALDTLRSLREQGYKNGLITVCSEDIELLWPESEFAGHFDAEVFSSSFGASKPDPRIYLECCARLGVDPADAVFVGDGANDELAGAQRVGMQAILIHRAGEDPLWPEVLEWDGPRVTSIPGVLEVVER